MADDRIDPYRQFRFRIEIDGIRPKGGFSECSFADTNTDVVEYRKELKTRYSENYRD